MKAVILIGIQAAGKTTFYQQRFFRTHVRINLDMLKTRHREKILTQACIDAQQPFVSDNTNISRAVRAMTIEPARAAGFQVIGYYFQAALSASIARNAARPAAEQIPAIGISGTYKKLQLPALDEGFDQLFYVRIDENDDFVIEGWNHEI